MTKNTLWTLGDSMTFGHGCNPNCTSNIKDEYLLSFVRSLLSSVRMSKRRYALSDHLLLEKNSQLGKIMRENKLFH